MARVEVEVQALKREFQEHKEETAKNFEDVNKKLDKLLELRNKGAGVLWLLGGILGSSILGAIYEIAHIFGGK